ncbi:MAG: hypothetical protein M0Z54_07465 [Thermaerobacter sp.]|nr:hypothetical protein [Thermaerobacter sp.]
MLANNRWGYAVRILIGGYFVWRGVYKLVTPAAVWMVPRVTAALPTTPLASLIRHWVFPHAAVLGLALGVVEVTFGLLLVLRRDMWLPPATLAALNALFFLTLGFQEPHDLELNLLMGVLNLWMVADARRQRPRRYGHRQRANRHGT